MVFIIVVGGCIITASMPIRYSDSSFRFFDEQNRARERARLAGVADPLERLADYTLRRDAERVIRFAKLNHIDLSDPEVRESVANLARAGQDFSRNY
jgi:hypothetical protein